MDDPCIEWWGGRNQRGYGYFMRNGTQIAAHRNVWEVCFRTHS